MPTLTFGRSVLTAFQISGHQYLTFEWSLLFYIFIGSSLLKPPKELKYNLHGSNRKKLHLINKEILLLYAVPITHEMKRPAVALFLLAEA